MSLRLGVLGVMASLLVTAMGPASADVRFQSPVFSRASYDFHYENTDWSSQVAVGDLNGDGRVDAVAGVLIDSLAVYFGRGNGEFDTPMTVPASGGLSAPVVADFDGDGAPDLGWAGYLTMGVAFGDGSGHSWSTVTLSSPREYWGTASGDFDGDGCADLAAYGGGSFSNPTSPGLDIYLSRPGHAFVRTSLPGLSEGLFHGMVARDFDRDGRSDLLLNMAGGSHVLLSNGDGTFTDAAVLSAGGGVDVGDVTGDGVDDIVSEEFYLWIWPGSGDGTFAPGIGASVWYTGHQLAVGDVTGDGAADIVYSSRSGYSGGDLIVLEALGGGSFGPPQLMGLGCAWDAIHLVDLDHDGRVDYLGLARDALVSALGDGAGGVRRTSATLPVTFARSALAVDLDQDGIDDLAVVAGAGFNELVVALGRPDRQLSPHTPIVLPDMAADLHAVDLDEDGCMDVVGVLGGSRLAWLRGDCGGGLGAPSVIALDGCGWFVVLRDVTGDGHVDAVYGSADGSLRAAAGDGLGHFAAPVVTPLVVYPGAPTWMIDAGDLDGDGDADLGVVARQPYGQEYRARLYRCLGDGTGHFVPEVLEDVASSALRTGVAVRDMNADGRVDLVTLQSWCGWACSGSDGPGWTGAIVTRAQVPSGAMAAAHDDPGPRSGRGFLRDVDGDDVPDLVTENVSGPAIQLGNGLGGFLPVVGSGGSGNPPLAAGDFDGDGRIDIASADAGDETLLRILYGRESEPPLLALSTPVGASLPIGDVASIEWSASDAHGVASIDLFVSRHGARGPFERIAIDQPNTGHYEWLVTQPVSDSVAFKVVARDSADNVTVVVGDSLGRITPTPSGVDASRLGAARVAIRGVTPNPIRERFGVDYSLPRAGRVTLELLDLSGRRIATLHDGPRPAGAGRIDAACGASAPGIYFVRLHSGGQTAIRRVSIIR